jgi:hypothetical protein
MEKIKLTAHQCYVKSKEENLTKEQHKELLKENNIIIGIRTSFTDMLKNKYPEIDVEKVLSVFEKQYKTICPSEPIVPLNSDLNKHLLVAVLDECSKTIC